MAKAKTKKANIKRGSALEMDSVFIFKLVLFLILGSQWLYLVNGDNSSELSIPIGAIIGVAFAAHDHFKIDRKIEYALLLLAMFISFWLPMGINLVI